jgi:signal transduction histidine kinase
VQWFLLGIIVGALGATLGAWWWVRRFWTRARVAERRAASAQRMAEIGAMTGGLAHEIKNPLSTIGLNAQLLAEGVEELPVPPDEKGRLTRRIGALRRETERLRGILDDFLRYAGELRLDPHPIDLNEVISELADFFNPQAESLGARLSVTQAEGRLEVNADSRQLKQAILNLMLNAVQAMASQPPDRPRELMLRTDRAQDDDRAPVVTVHVVDTGPGMSPETRANLFKPYFTTKSGGTGLGLPTARRIIEAHAGRLDVHSEEGKGTSFMVVLPALHRA